MNSITVDQVIPVLNKIVDEVGSDFVYQRPMGVSSCLYVWQGEPHCIVGKVLAHFGLSLPKEETQISSLNATRLTGLIGNSPPRTYEALAPDAVTLLDFIQQRQDHYTPWGRAVAEGINYLNKTAAVSKLRELVSA